MKKRRIKGFRVNPKEVLSAEESKSVLGGSTATLNCSNGSSMTVHHSTCSNPAEMNLICYHLGGPGTVWTSCS